MLSACSDCSAAGSCQCLPGWVGHADFVTMDERGRVLECPTSLVIVRGLWISVLTVALFNLLQAPRALHLQLAKYGCVVSKATTTVVCGILCMTFMVLTAVLKLASHDLSATVGHSAAVSISLVATRLPFIFLVSTFHYETFKLSLGSVSLKQAVVAQQLQLTKTALIITSCAVAICTISLLAALSFSPEESARVVHEVLLLVFLGGTTSLILMHAIISTLNVRFFDHLISLICKSARHTNTPEGPSEARGTEDHALGILQRARSSEFNALCCTVLLLIVDMSLCAMPFAWTKVTYELPIHSHVLNKITSDVFCLYGATPWSSFVQHIYTFCRMGCRRRSSACTPGP